MSFVFTTYVLLVLTRCSTPFFESEMTSMRLGSSLVRCAAGLALASMWCNNSLVESSDPECAASGVVNEMEVKATSDVTALRALLNSCAGGMFDVTWQGRVAANESFIVVNGTSLNITGVMSTSSSTQPSSDGGLAHGLTSTAVGVIEGEYGSPFHVHANSTLSLASMVLEFAHPESPRGYGAIVAHTHETSELGNLAAVNVIDCEFRNNTAWSYGELAAVTARRKRHIVEVNLSGITPANAHRQFTHTSATDSEVIAFHASHTACRRSASHLFDMSVKISCFFTLWCSG